MVRQTTPARSHICSNSCWLLSHRRQFAEAPRHRAVGSTPKVLPCPVIGMQTTPPFLRPLAALACTATHAVAVASIPSRDQGPALGGLKFRRRGIGENAPTPGRGPGTRGPCARRKNTPEPNGKIRRRWEIATSQARRLSSASNRPVSISLISPSWRLRRLSRDSSTSRWALSRPSHSRDQGRFPPPAETVPGKDGGPGWRGRSASRRDADIHIASQNPPTPRAASKVTASPKATTVMANPITPSAQRTVLHDPEKPGVVIFHCPTHRWAFHRPSVLVRIARRRRRNGDVPAPHRRQYDKQIPYQPDKTDGRAKGYALGQNADQQQNTQVKCRPTHGRAQQMDRQHPHRPSRRRHRSQRPAQNRGHKLPIQPALLEQYVERQCRTDKPRLR